MGRLSRGVPEEGITVSEQALLDVDDSVLVVIDVQERFLGKLPAEQAEGLLGRICWLVEVARWAGVPLVVTAEDMTLKGGVHPRLAELLPHDCRVYDKNLFGLAAEPRILRAVEETRRRSAILVGLETDVCVAQSAIGLMEHGYRVAVLEDAVGSPGAEHARGLARMRAAGALVLGVKGLLYEWLRSSDESGRFQAECGTRLGAPPGVIL